MAGYSKHQSKPHLLIMAGGTGGHIFPGLAVARAMQQAGWQISWLGGLNGLESKLVPEAGLKLHTLPIQGIRGKGMLGLVAAPYRLIGAIYKAWRIVRRLRPDVVIGFGGYASGPGGMAAWLLRIPLIIHEQNAIPGMTNRILARLARIVLQAFPDTFASSKQALTVGNPIREELLSIAEPRVRMAERSKPWRLLILGGSRGAIALNKAIADGLALLPADQRPEVWHQTGIEHLAVTKKQYELNSIVARVEPFIDNMALAYAWPDLVICRAGALTVSELAAVGIGSILVPYPYAVDDHQTVNAEFLKNNDAALIVSQQSFTPKQFVELYLSIIQQPQACIAMAEAAYKQRQVSATSTIKQECEKFLYRK